jgi:hypothetical protein
MVRAATGPNPEALNPEGFDEIEGLGTTEGRS